MTYKECEEPRCVRPAEKKYRGKNVCHDCYDKYIDQEHRQKMDLPDF